MGLFGKKKEEEKLNKAAKEAEIKKATYKIILKEKLGSTTRTIKKFDAIRWIDETDHVVYLKNDGLKFVEIFPEDMKDFASYEQKEVEKKLKSLKEDLKNEMHVDTEDVNDNNLEFEILKLEAKLRSFKFSKNSSYITFEDDGPVFYFLREGSTFFPFKWDPDTKSIYTPSDNKKKSAAIALRNKENKYQTANTITTISIFMLALGIIFMLGSAYMTYKNYKGYDETELAELKREVAGCGLDLVEQTERQAKTISKIVNDLDKQINKPQTVIEGVVPE